MRKMILMYFLASLTLIMFGCGGGGSGDSSNLNTTDNTSSTGDDNTSDDGSSDSGSIATDVETLTLPPLCFNRQSVTISSSHDDGPLEVDANIVFQYDSSGRCVGASWIENQDVYTYYDDGKIATMEHYEDYNNDGNDNYIVIQEYFYDDSGKLEEMIATQTSYNDEGDQVSQSNATRKYTYESGLLSTREDVRVSGSLTFTLFETYNYDSNGRLVSYTSERDDDGDGKVDVTDNDTITYNNNGDVIQTDSLEVEEDGSEDDLVEEYFYNNSGQMISNEDSWIRRDSSGAIAETETENYEFTYNSDGDLIRIDKNSVWDTLHNQYTDRYVYENTYRQGGMPKAQSISFDALLIPGSFAPVFINWP